MIGVKLSHCPGNTYGTGEGGGGGGGGAVLTRSHPVNPPTFHINMGILAFAK